MNNEIWKDITGYENIYQVSNSGNVKNIKTNKLLKLSYSHNGYKLVSLNRKTFRVHRLVAQAFIQNPNNLPQVNHKDFNKENNNVSNLEWCDMKYNNIYGNRIKKASNSCKKKVQCIETGVIYDSAKDVEVKLNINHSHISDCCRGKRNKTGGYSWRFVNA